LSVIAERITASCHSSGTARRRDQRRQYSAVCSSKSRAVSSIPADSVSSAPSRQDEAQVIAAARDLGRRRPPLPARADDEANPRVADQRPHPTHDLGRPERAVAVEEARAEIDDFDALAGGVEKPRSNDRGARVVGLLRACEPFQLDAEHTALRRAGGVAEQRMKDRIAVEARYAAPDDGGALVDQGADRAVADQGKIQIGRIWCHGRGKMQVNGSGSR
jgi:hypothetical protein